MSFWSLVANAAFADVQLTVGVVAAAAAGEAAARVGMRTPAATALTTSVLARPVDIP